MNTFDHMLERGHERVCYHIDHETGLKAIIAVHSTKLGNALGGTRRWHYASHADALYDVMRLSEGMTYKAAAAGLPMGGAKSVILLPKHGHKATEAEARAMGRFVDTFNGTYIAAEDVGVDTQFVDWMAHETKHVMGGKVVSVGGDPSPHTAEGVVNAMKACLTHAGRSADFAGLKVAIQGVGHVGYHVARILHEGGAKLVVADINQANLKRCVDEFEADVEEPQKILRLECDILCPCALGGVIDGTLARQLKTPILCGAANNILEKPLEDAAVLRSAGVVYAPDFVANAGGLIWLAGLYLGMTEHELDQKVAEIEKTTAAILKGAERAESTYAAAIAYANQQIEKGAARRKEEVPTGKARPQVHAG